MPGRHRRASYDRIGVQAMKGIEVRHLLPGSPRAQRGRFSGAIPGLVVLGRHAHTPTMNSTQLKLASVLYTRRTTETTSDTV